VTVRTLVLLCPALAALALLAPAQAAQIITPTVADFSSEEPGFGGRLAIHTVDGSGFVSPPSMLTPTNILTLQHDNTDRTNGWHQDSPDDPPDPSDEFIVFDLGTAGLGDNLLSRVFIWQYTEGGRDLNEFDLLVSPDSNPVTASYTNVGTFFLPNEADGPQLANILDLSGVSNVRLVQIDITSNHGDGGGLVGIGEIRFQIQPIPEPATATSVLLGLIGLPWLRKRRDGFAGVSR